MTSTDDSRFRRLLADLVRIETENPPGNEAPCAEYIYDWFASRDVDVELVDEPWKDRPQVVARVGAGHPTIVLNGHTDVVPAGDRSKWDYDPYGAEVVDGKLYGRGSADMKAGLAIAMLAAVDLRDDLESGDLSGSIVVQAAAGEERTEPGTKTLIERGYHYDADYAIVLEPKTMRTSTCQKGLVWYEITVEGEPAHAGRADEGVNAIQLARPILDALSRYDERVREEVHELVGKASATITQFDAGTMHNVVPERATITLDRRFLPGTTSADIDEEIDAVLAEVEDEHGVEATWRRIGATESAEIDPHSRLPETVRRHSHEIAGVSLDPWGTKASDDARHFVNIADVETITWGPAAADEAHTFNEHVDLEWNEMGLEVLERSLRELLTDD